MDGVSPLLFQCLCVLAVIPAATETLGLLMHMCFPRPNAGGNTRLDYLAAAAWVSALFATQSGDPNHMSVRRASSLHINVLHSQPAC